MILSPAPQDINDVVSTTYDFVVIGGGTAGLTLATLLTEDPAVKVLVIDKGVYRPDDLRILTPYLWDRQIGDPEYDHLYLSVPQEELGGAPVLFSAGRTLGGTSAFNAMTWIQIPANELEGELFQEHHTEGLTRHAAWTELGNNGWDWNTYLKYAKEVESFKGATKEAKEVYAATAAASERGETGRIPLTTTNFFSSTVPVFYETLSKIGVPTNEDPRLTRTNAGAWTVQNNIDEETNERAYVATKYYKPVANRKNLVVVTQALAHKILFSDTPNANGELTAVGVEFHYNGAVVSAKASREVILSAGNITSPKILELSGVGNPKILEQFGIDVKINLPGVGENFQDHVAFNHGFPIIGDYTTLDLLRDPVIDEQEREKYEKTRAGLYGAGMSSLAYLTNENLFSKEEIADMQKILDEEIKSGKLSPGLRAQYQIMYRWLADGQIPWAEIFPQFKFFFLPGTPPPANERAITMPTFLVRPFSRGTVHIKSTNPEDQPTIDPQVYTHPLDKKIALAAMKFSREKLRKTEPMASILGDPVVPPPGATDEELWKMITSIVVTGHGIGTCSMLPKELGGVVDDTLKVYGTTNLRVVDCSVYPLHASCHTASPTYTTAHKAAAYIKEHILTN